MQIANESGTVLTSPENVGPAELTAAVESASDGEAGQMVDGGMNGAGDGGAPKVMQNTLSF